MRNVVLVLCLLFVAYVHSQDWQSDFRTAMQKAKVEEKLVLLVFSGSDWCAPCIRLDRNIWQSDAFKSYATDHFVLYKADFPRKKKNALPEKKMQSNRDLAELYNPNGHFPWVLVLNEHQKILGTISFQNQTSNEYIELLAGYVR
ncbi:MAG: thioredoxin family protein [Bacteroidota bacterium]